MGSEEKTILDYATPKRNVNSKLFVLIVVLLLGTAVVFAFWPSRNTGVPAKQTICAANMRAIGQMLIMYRNQHKSGPDSMDSLLDCASDMHQHVPYDGSARPDSSRLRTRYLTRCVCPLSNATRTGKPSLLADYSLTAAGNSFVIGPPNAVVLIESACRHNGRMNILFADGSVRSISAAESQAMLADLNAGKNPPPSLQSKVER